MEGNRIREIINSAIYKEFPKGRLVRELDNPNAELVNQFYRELYNEFVAYYKGYIPLNELIDNNGYLKDKGKSFVNEYLTDFKEGNRNDFIFEDSIDEIFNDYGKVQRKESAPKVERVIDLGDVPTVPVKDIYPRAKAISQPSISSSVKINREESIKSKDEKENYYFDKYEVHRKKVDFAVKAILSLVVAAIVISGVKSSKSNNNISSLKDVTNFSYPEIHTSVNENYARHVNNVIAYYDEVNNTYVDASDTFSHMGIYFSYKSVKENSLAVMDDMIRAIKNNAEQKGSGLYEEIADCQIFLDYVVMIMTDNFDYEIDADCMEAIEEYRKLYNASVELPFDKLDRKYQRELENLMKDYRENFTQEIEKCGQYIDDYDDKSSRGR